MTQLLVQLHKSTRLDLSEIDSSEIKIIDCVCRVCEAKFQAKSGSEAERTKLCKECM